MSLAHLVTKNSPAKGRIVGCVLVGRDDMVAATGTNILAHGCEDHPERFDAPEKYDWVEHAERAAVYQAAREGLSTQGCTAFTTLFPCTDCARALVLSGIVRIVSPHPDFSDPRWGEKFRLSEKIFEECGVEVTYSEGD